MRIAGLIYKKMKKLLLFILLFVGCDNSTEPDDVVDEKIEVNNFALTFYNSFFENDIATFQASFLDTIYILEDGSKFPLFNDQGQQILPIDNLFYELINHDHIYAYSLDDYSYNYETTVYTFNEYSELNNDEILNYDWVTDADYIFTGIPNNIEIADFIPNDLQILIITKINSKWWIKGFGEL